MLAIKECLRREGVLNLNSGSAVGVGVGVGSAGGVASSGNNNINNNHTISNNDHGFGYVLNGAANNNNNNNRNHNYNHNNANNHGNNYYYNKNSNDYNKMNKNTEWSGVGVGNNNNQQTELLSYQKSVASQSPEIEIGKVSPSSNLSSTSATANTSCQIVEQPPSHQHQQPNPPKKPIRYQGQHPHFHHHTTPAYYTDVNLRIHTPDAADVAALNENYQSVYGTQSQLVGERRFPKTSTATVAPPPIGTGSAVSKSPKSLSTSAIASPTAPTVARPLQPQRDQQQQQQQARAAFFRGGSAGHERRSLERFAKWSPGCAVDPAKGEYNSSTSAYPLQAAKSDGSVSFTCAYIQPTPTTAETRSASPVAREQNLPDASAALTSPTSTAVAGDAIDVPRSRNQQRFCNRKRVLRVRSESRPISALYDIICKEKGLDIGSTTSTSTNTSATSGSSSTASSSAASNDERPQSDLTAAAGIVGAGTGIGTGTGTGRASVNSPAEKSRGSVEKSRKTKRIRKRGRSGSSVIVLPTSVVATTTNGFDLAEIYRTANAMSSSLDSRSFNAESVVPKSFDPPKRAANSMSRKTSHPKKKTRNTHPSTQTHDLSEDDADMTGHRLKPSQKTTNLQSLGIQSFLPSELEAIFLPTVYAGDHHRLERTHSVEPQNENREPNEWQNRSPTKCRSLSLNHNSSETSNPHHYHNHSRRSHAHAHNHAHNHSDVMVAAPPTTNHPSISLPQTISMTMPSYTISPSLLKYNVCRRGSPLPLPLPTHQHQHQQHQQQHQPQQHQPQQQQLQSQSQQSSLHSSAGESPCSKLNGSAPEFSASQRAPEFAYDPTQKLYVEPVSLLITGSSSNALCASFIDRPGAGGFEPHGRSRTANASARTKKEKSVCSKTPTELGRVEQGEDCDPSPPTGGAKRFITRPNRIPSRGVYTAGSAVRSDSSSPSPSLSPSPSSSAIPSRSSQSLRATTTLSQQQQLSSSSATALRVDSPPATLTNGLSYTGMTNSAATVASVSATPPVTVTATTEPRTPPTRPTPQDNESRTNTESRIITDKKKDEELQQQTKRFASPTSPHRSSPQRCSPQSSSPKLKTSDRRKTSPSGNTTDDSSPTYCSRPTSTTDLYPSARNHRHAHILYTMKNYPDVKGKSRDSASMRLPTSASSKLEVTLPNMTEDADDIDVEADESAPIAQATECIPRPRCSTMYSDESRNSTKSSSGKSQEQSIDLSPVLKDRSVGSSPQRSEDRDKSAKRKSNLNRSLAEESTQDDDEALALRRRRRRELGMARQLIPDDDVAIREMIAPLKGQSSTNSATFTIASESSGDTRSPPRSNLAYHMEMARRGLDLQQPQLQPQPQSQPQPQRRAQTASPKIESTRRKTLEVAAVIKPTSTSRISRRSDTLPLKSSATDQRRQRSSDVNRKLNERTKSDLAEILKIAEMANKCDDLSVSAATLELPETEAVHTREMSPAIAIVDLTESINRIQTSYEYESQESVPLVDSTLDSYCMDSTYSPIKHATFVQEDCVYYDPEPDEYEIESSLLVESTSLRQRMLKARSIERDTTTGQVAPKFSPILRRKSTDEPAMPIGLSPIAVTQNHIVSILKKKDHIGESSSASSTASPVTFSSNVVDSQTRHKRPGILKKRSSLDESRYYSRSHSPDERSILVKSARRNSLEEGATTSQQHGILKQSSYDSSKSDGCPSAAEPHPPGILKKKDSTSTPSDSGTHVAKHVSISQAVILAAAELGRETGEPGSLDFDEVYTPSNEEYEIRPILKQENTSSDDAIRTPKPILKKKSSGDSDEHEIRPILKTSRKSSREEFDLNDTQGEEPRQHGEPSVRPILKTDSPSKRRSLGSTTEAEECNGHTSPSLLKRRTRSLERQHNSVVDLGAALSAISSQQAQPSDTTASTPTTTMSVAERIKSMEKFLNGSHYHSTVNAMGFANGNLKSSAIKRDMYRDRYKTQPVTIEEKNFFKASSTSTPFEGATAAAKSFEALNYVAFAGQLPTPSPVVSNATFTLARSLTQPLPPPPATSTPPTGAAASATATAAAAVTARATVLHPLVSTHKSPSSTSTSTTSTSSSTSAIVTTAVPLKRHNLPQHFYYNNYNNSNNSNSNTNINNTNRYASASVSAGVFNGDGDSSTLSVSVSEQLTHSLGSDSERIFEMSGIDTSKDTTATTTTTDLEMTDRNEVLDDAHGDGCSSPSQSGGGGGGGIVRKNSVRARANMFQQLEEKTRNASVLAREGRVSPRRAAPLRVSPSYMPSGTSPTEDIGQAHNSDEEIEPSSLPLAERLRFFSNLSVSANYRSPASSCTRSPPFSSMERSLSTSSYSYYLSATPRSSTTASSASVTPTPMEYLPSTPPMENGYHSVDASEPDTPTELSLTSSHCMVKTTSAFLRLEKSASHSRVSSPVSTPTSSLTPTMQRIKLKTIGKLMLPQTFLHNDRNNNSNNNNNGSGEYNGEFGSAERPNPKKIGKIKSPFIENCQQLQQKQQLNSKCMKYDLRSTPHNTLASLENSTSVENGTTRKALHFSQQQQHQHQHQHSQLQQQHQINGTHDDSSTDSGKENYDESSSVTHIVERSTTPVVEMRKKITRMMSTVSNGHAPVPHRMPQRNAYSGTTLPQARKPLVDERYAKYFGLPAVNSASTVLKEQGRERASVAKRNKQNIETTQSMQCVATASTASIYRSVSSRPSFNNFDQFMLDINGPNVTPSVDVINKNVRVNGTPTLSVVSSLESVRNVQTSTAITTTTTPTSTTSTTSLTQKRRSDNLRRNRSLTSIAYTPSQESFRRVVVGAGTLRKRALTSGPSHCLGMLYEEVKSFDDIVVTTDDLDLADENFERLYNEYFPIGRTERKII